MKQSKHGFGLAEVIISFTLMVILIGILAMAINFSQHLYLQAEEVRQRTDEAAIAFAQEIDVLISSDSATLTFGDGLLQFSIPVALQVRQITMDESEVVTFRVYAEP